MADDSLDRGNFRTHVEQLRDTAKVTMGNLWTELWTATPGFDAATSFGVGAAADLGRSYLTVVDVLNARQLHALDVIEASGQALAEIAGVYAIADGQE